MDNNSFTSQAAVRYDHLQRLLKQYESEALNSLRGPAGVGSSSTSLDGDKLLGSYRQNQNQNNQKSESIARRNNVDESSAVVLADRSSSAVLQKQETLLKEILTLRGAVPVQPLPVLSAQDRTSGGSERREALIEGEIITCFVVGGEKRLCLPQLLNTVLKNVSMVDINRACTELNIHCGHCTPEQLLVLKIAGVVSATTASCALITKTDAERLCDNLLRQRRKGQGQAAKIGNRSGSSIVAAHYQRSSSVETPYGSRLSNSSSRLHSHEANEARERDIAVIHFCFGRCRGRYRSWMYASPSAECIECDECGQLYAPDRFVVHSHGNQERRTCHWGFDSANWRAYLHLTDEDECDENLKIFDEMKIRFDVNGLTKRKFDLAETGGSEAKKMAAIDDLQPPNKRIRLDGLVEQRPQQSQPATTTGPAVAREAIVDKLSTINLPGIDQASLPYLLCDPLLLAAYYQAALAAATATIRAATTTSTVPPQSSNSTNTIIPPSFLPPHPFSLTTAPVVSQKQQQQQTAAIVGAGLTLDGFGMKTGQLPLQPPPRQRESQQQLLMRDRPFLDEDTAAAALKLLQMHAGGGGGDYQKANGFGGGDYCKDETVEKNSVTISNSVKTSGGVQQNSASFAKEPFKKQLLHLFAVEQQQKEEQRRHQQHLQEQMQQTKEAPKASDLGQRGSVEIIVDDDGVDQEQARRRQRPPIGQRLHQSTSSSESERLDGCANVDNSTPDTQVADELSVSSSDNEGANGELSLDDLLRRYISDVDGLKIVRSQIAANQRYLEQKLDAVSAENRLLHAECLQLRTKQWQQQRRQQENQQEQVGNIAANLLGKGGIGNLMGFLPKQFTI